MSLPCPSSQLRRILLLLRTEVRSDIRIQSLTLKGGSFKSDVILDYGEDREPSLLGRKFDHLHM